MEHMFLYVLMIVGITVFSELNYRLIFHCAGNFPFVKNKLSSKFMLYQACVTGCFSLVKCL